MDTTGEQELIDRFRRCGLRATGQRLAILRMLRTDRSHPSAEQIYLRMKSQHPTLSLSTVYKTLQTLAQMNVLQTIDSGTGKQRFDGQPIAHHHAVCNFCGQISDVAFEKFPYDLPSEDIVPEFFVHKVKVYFSGRCWACNGGPQPS
jgi:Fur family peroxide stress response transcriptional regulator